MKPTIGRIVHFYGDEDEPIAAVVVRVWDEECVNLRLLEDGPDTPWMTSVPYHEDKREFSWSWPPLVH